MLYKIGNDYVCFFSLVIEPKHQNQGHALKLRLESLRHVLEQYPAVPNILIARYGESNSYTTKNFPHDSMFNQIPQLAIKHEVIDWQGIPVNFYYLSLLAYENLIQSKIAEREQKFTSSSSQS